MKWILTLSCIICCSGALFSQINDRSTFAVFFPIEPNDTVLIAAGQVLSGTDMDNSLHGYYPLQQTMLSVSEHLPNDYQVNVFPNPFQDLIYVTLNNNYINSYSIEITDVSGAIVFAEKNTFQLSEISCIHWGRGIYIIRILSNDGSLIFAEKIVKQ